MGLSSLLGPHISNKHATQDSFSFIQKIQKIIICYAFVGFDIYY